MHDIPQATLANSDPKQDPRLEWRAQARSTFVQGYALLAVSIGVAIGCLTLIPNLVETALERAFTRRGNADFRLAALVPVILIMILGTFAFGLRFILRRRQVENELQRWETLSINSHQLTPTEYLALLELGPDERTHDTPDYQMPLHLSSPTRGKRRRSRG